jgi:hypothetical protein
MLREIADYVGTPNGDGQMSRIVLFLILISISILSCGPSRTEFQAQKMKADSLQTELITVKEAYELTLLELDSLKFGASKLLMEAQKLFDSKRYDEAIKTIDLLISKHPVSPETDFANSLKTKAQNEIVNIEKEASATKQKKEAEEKRRLDRATSKMEKNFDEIEGVTWYKDKSITSEVRMGKHLYLYVGKSATSTWLRMRLQYAGVSWLFIKHYTIKVDDKMFTLNPNYDDIKKESYTTIWEWYDKVVTGSDMQMIQAIANSKKTVIRFEGDTYSKDWEVPSSTKRAMQNVLDAFVALGGDLNNP